MLIINIPPVGMLKLLAALLITVALVIYVYLNQAQFTNRLLTVYQTAFDLASDTGIIREESYISGTGSMYPTFPKGTGKTKLEQMREVAGVAKVRKYPGGITLFGKRYFDYRLQRGDIVFFSNSKTAQIVAHESEGQVSSKTGFVKRLAGLPADTIEIRDGFVKLNGEVLSEPYIASARSTYGGDFLPDCQSLAVPEGFVFVMGDNRKESNDSRFDVGLVAMADINSVIPWMEQDNFKPLWRDTSHDLDRANQPTLSASSYLKLLNQKRIGAGLKPFTYQPKLEGSAGKRAEVILKFNDLSFEATRSGYTMEKAMQDVGYYNITWGEAPTLGYYTAEELIENSFQFPKRKEFLLNKDFQEIGIAVKVGQVNGCPVQVVVQHMAGYVPPNYQKEDTESLKDAILRLKEIQPGWEELKNKPDFYSSHQEEVDKMTAIISQRIAGLTTIFNRMEANQWLTEEEKKLLEQDKALGEEQNSLADKLNGL